MKWWSSLVSISGGVMGLLLVFRINAINDRYYEAALSGRIEVDLNVLIHHSPSNILKTKDEGGVQGADNQLHLLLAIAYSRSHSVVRHLCDDSQGVHH